MADARRPDSSDSSDPFTSVLVGFAHELRGAGLTVGTGDVLTYFAAMTPLDPTDLIDLYWAGRATLVAIIVSVIVGGAVLVPSLILLYSLFLRGKLDVGTGEEAGTPRPPSARPAAPPAVRTPAVAFAAVTLLAGVVLLVFTDPPWTHGLGAVCLIACAVRIFTLTATPD